MADIGMDNALVTTGRAKNPLQTGRVGSQGNEVLRSVKGTSAEPSRGFFLPYPVSKTIDVVDQYFGTAVKDPYRWLEDASSPEVKTWMASQHKLSRAVINSFPGREKLVNRLKELLYIDSIDAPSKRGERFFYYKKSSTQEKFVYCFREGKSGKERVLLDPNKLILKGNVSLGVTVPSYDGKKLAYALRKNNADEAILYVMDVASGRTSKIDKISGAKYAWPNWTPSGDGFYYTWIPTDPKIPVADRPGRQEVRFHRLGTDPRTDKTVFNRTNDPTTFVVPQLSRDGKWLFVYICRAWGTADLFYKDVTKPDSEFKLLYKKDRQARVIPWREKFYILTNDGSPNWRIDRVDAAHPEQANWRTIVPEGEKTVINDMSIIGGHLVLKILKNAASTLEVRDLDGRFVRAVSVPDLGDTGRGDVSPMVGNPDEDEAYFSFNSYTTPRRIYRTSISTGETSLWAKINVPVDTSPYVAKQVYYPSKDGTRVSMFIFHRRDMPHDGSTPFLLTGYGGFNASLTPAFLSTIYPWLEAGGAYAAANLRGGGEYGEKWHREGMLLEKQNTFDDFIAGAEFLIKKGYTNPERLAIRGASNGGLLVGAALTQRPDLFRAVVCGVPLLDMLRYHKFGSGKTWISEYGSSGNPEQFKALFAYSPYHHVSKGVPYPATLFLSSDSDDRVDPMHARKMTAALQNTSSSGRPVLLRIQKNAGHGGADQIKETVEQEADVYSFLMNQLFPLKNPPLLK